MIRSVSIAILLAGVVILAIAFVRRTSPRDVLPSPGVKDSDQTRQATPPADFVGAKNCGGCHESELKQWTGSHHQLAMQQATDATVLGDFNDASLVIGGVRSRFFRRGASFIVSTDGPVGAIHDYEIKFTFGVSPLQQYLIELPGGRLQAFGIAWDSRSRERGGQRWYHLYPGRPATSHDSLHWTGIDQNWNFMCADCHSTNLRRNYDPATRTFATSFAEIDVACEACHGPGSNHVDWANKRGDWKQFDANKGLLIALNERSGVAWAINPATGNASRTMPRTSEREIQMCARCHSRRAEIREDYVHGQPVGDAYRVSLLDDGLYYPDGQIKDEVYEYGSFIQSKMFHAGVTCSDCHEPHCLKLRADGNNLCAQCHSAQKYDSRAHHFHPRSSAGARCVECHMPARTYMVVDARRDHSIRIPRPDLSAKLGTPNACNNCHANRSAKWAAETIVNWYGHAPTGYQRFAEALHAGSLGGPGAEHSLEALVAEKEQPAIARASAVAMLSKYVETTVPNSMRAAAADSSPLVRRAAARAMSDAEPHARVEIVAPLLAGPVRDVRIEAAETLAGIPRDSLPAGVAVQMRAATDEYIAAQKLNSDRPEAHLNLALLYAKEKRFANAENELKIALSLDPSFGPAAVNLADLDRALGRDADGERVLREAIAHSPTDASLEHSLGLALVRGGHRQDALTHLASATRLDSLSARFGYVYAIALSDAGRTNDAIEELERVVRRHPYDRDSLGLIANLYESIGNPAQALAYASRLAQLRPDDQQVSQLLKRLRAEAR